MIVFQPAQSTQINTASACITVGAEGGRGEATPTMTTMGNQNEKLAPMKKVRPKFWIVPVCAGWPKNVRVGSSVRLLA